MKILLINPPVRTWAKPNIFPLGLGYIAAILVREGYLVEVLDINAHRYSSQEVEDKIRNADFDIVGIGGIITTYKYIKWLIEVLNKYHPNKAIVIGGSVGSSIPDIMFKNQIKAICRGEGEETTRELIKCLKNDGELSQVRGIWYKDIAGNVCRTPERPPIQNLDDIPFPQWDIFPVGIYLRNPVGALNRQKWVDGDTDSKTILSMNIFATRGCPYKCIYCYHDFMGYKYRHRSPANILREIAILYERYKVPYFHFIDDEFVMDKDFVYKFCSLLKAYSKDVGAKITWGCAGRANLMTEDLVKTMADSGCVLIGYGIESGSQKMLDFIKKGVTVEQAKNAIRLTQKYLGWADCSFMIGYPGETMSTIQETVDFCKELNLAPEVVFFLTPYPGTELYDMALKDGRIKNEEDYILSLGEQGERIAVNFTEFSDDELYKIQEKVIIDLKAWNKVKHSQMEIIR